MVPPRLAPRLAQAEVSSVNTTCLRGAVGLMAVTACGQPAPSAVPHSATSDAMHGDGGGASGLDVAQCPVFHDPKRLARAFAVALDAHDFATVACLSHPEDGLTIQHTHAVPGGRVASLVGRVPAQWFMICGQPMLAKHYFASWRKLSDREFSLQNGWTFCDAPKADAQGGRYARFAATPERCTPEPDRFLQLDRTGDRWFVRGLFDEDLAHHCP